MHDPVVGRTMTAPTLAELTRGDVIRISFGSHGSQLAIVHDRTRAGNVRVWKFSAKRSQWKGPIRLYDGEIISRDHLPTSAFPAAFFNS